jgi:hypothetical protein
MHLGRINALMVRGGKDVLAIYAKRLQGKITKTVIPLELPATPQEDSHYAH